MWGLRHKFSKVLSIVPFSSKHTRTLTFENFRQYLSSDPSSPGLFLHASSFQISNELGVCGEVHDGRERTGGRGGGHRLALVRVEGAGRRGMSAY